MGSRSPLRFVYELREGKQRYLGKDQDGIMYIGYSALNCVVFIGIADDRPGKGGIHPVATGFFLAFGGYLYLITAKHVIHPFRDAPFVIRGNGLDGKGRVVFVEDADWIEHPDPTVDLAAWDLFTMDKEAQLDVRFIPEGVIAPPVSVRRDVPVREIGLGDLCHMVGLFQFHPGSERNMPVVHTGNLAMIPEDELIPTRDWENPRKTRLIRGYLVEGQSLRGLSGCPVFVRQSHVLNFRGILKGNEAIISPIDEIQLLGIWQGAWDAAADEVLGLALGLGEQRVPVGMGVVVPAHHVKEMLNQPDVKERREKALGEAALVRAAKPDRPGA